MKLITPHDVLSFTSEAGRQMLEAPLYSAGIALYRFGVRIAGLKNEKARKLDHGQRETWNRISGKIKPGNRVIWIHAASLGEFEQGRPLIEKIKRKKPEYKILLTFFSPSGYEVRKDYDKADCVCYLPFDTPHRVKRFIETVRPEKAIFVKYEIWRNYLHELYKHQIPTFLISAAFRPDQAFFKRSGAWYGLWLKWYTRIFVQDSRSKTLLESIGVTNVDVTGDTRFDRVADIRAKSKKIPELDRFLSRDSDSRPPVIMAGSSWPEDEAVYTDWINAHPDVKLVIAPHEFDAARLARLKERFSNGVVLLSEMKADPAAGDGKQVLVIDCFGLLSSAYAYCDIAYVGGGFGAGLHNINEAAVYDVPVIYGPNNHKFIEAQEMATLGGGLPIDSKESFNRWADRLVYDEKEREKRGRWAGEYIREKQGATDRVYSKIFTD